MATHRYSEERDHDHFLLQAGRQNPQQSSMCPMVPSLLKEPNLLCKKYNCAHSSAVGQRSEVVPVVPYTAGKFNKDINYHPV